MVVSPTQPVILRRDPDKYIVLLIVSLLFVAATAYLIWSTDRLTRSKHLVDYIGFIFFVICSIILAVMLFPGAGYLKLEPEGFIVSVFYLKEFTKWSDINEFGVFQAVNGSPMVGIKSATRVSSKRLRKWNALHFGYDGGLPDTYGMSAEALAALMNEALAEARARGC